MRYVWMAMLALLVAGAALADGNPDLLLGLDMDPPNEMNRYDPAISEIFSVYLVFREIGPGSGITGCSFMITRTFGGVYLSTTNMMNSGLIIGTPEVGCSLSAGGGLCIEPDGNGEVIAAEIQYLYTGVPGTLTLVPDPGQGAVATDCDVLLDTWTDYMNFGVGMDAPPSPVEEISWGSIKALYR